MYGVRCLALPCGAKQIRDTPRRCSFIFLRDGRDWGDHGRKLEGHQDRSWQGNVAGGVMGRDHERWQGTLAAYQCDRVLFYELLLPNER